ncbi:MAG: hypothetical protein ABSC03_07530 [Verrucomicrobiota bacterium]
MKRSFWQFWLARRIRNRRKEQYMRYEIAPPVSTPPSFATSLPDYIANATPNPKVNRVPWYNNTALTCAGIFLWFVFWQGATAMHAGFLGGTLAQGVGVAVCGLVISALICDPFSLRLAPLREPMPNLRRNRQ